jgi:hypothetical protein
MLIPEDDVNTYHIDSYAFYDTSDSRSPTMGFGEDRYASHEEALLLVTQTLIDFELSTKCIIHRWRR